MLELQTPIEKAEITNINRGKRAAVYVRNIGLVLLYLVPALAAIIFIKSFGVNTPNCDDWTLIDFYHRLSQGELTWQEIIFFENSEHKCITFYLFEIALIKLFSYNNIMMMYANLACLFIIGCVFTSWSWHRSSQVRSAPLLLIPIPLFELSVKQSESMLWSACLILGTVMLWIVLTFVFLEQSKKIDGWFFGALTTALIGTFNHALAVLLWPFGLMLLTLHVLWDPRDAEHKRMRLKDWYRPALWLVASATVLSVYFLSPHGVHPQHESIAYLKTDPLSLFLYFLGMVANPVACEITTGIAMGLLLCGMYVWFLLSAVKQDAETKKLLVLPVVLFAFGLAGAASITYGRFMGVVEHSLTTRYFCELSVPILGLYLGCLILSGTGKIAGPIRVGILVAVMIVGAIGGNLHGLEEAQAWKEQRLILINLIKHYRDQNPAAILEYTLGSAKWLPWMEQNKLCAFNEPDPPPLEQMQEIPIAGPFLLESINDEACHTYPLSRHVVIDSSKQTFVKFIGFAASFKTKKPACAVYITIDGKQNIPATMGLVRSKVARAYKRPAFVDSGFVACCDPTKLGKGLHDVGIKVCCDERTYYKYGPLIKLEVK